MNERDRAIFDMQAQALASKMLEVIEGSPIDLVMNAFAMLVAGIAAEAEEYSQGEYERHESIDKLAFMCHSQAEFIRHCKPIEKKDAN